MARDRKVCPTTRIVPTDFEGSVETIAVSIEKRCTNIEPWMTAVPYCEFLGIEVGGEEVFGETESVSVMILVGIIEQKS